MSLPFTTEFYDQALALFENYPRKVNALLPLLHLVQKEKGHIDADSMKEVSRLCETPISHVQGVVTFYTMYAQAPRGKCRLSVCTNISCYLKGAMDVLRGIEETLSIAPGESTSDGLFYLEEVECLGACGYAPVMMVDEKYHECVTPEKAEALIGEIKEKHA